MPTREVIIRVQVVGRACAGASQIVIVERQRRVRRCVAGIGLGSAGAEGSHHSRHEGEEAEK